MSTTSSLMVEQDGKISWYNEKRQLHREDGPAVIHLGISESWFRNGERHREDGPAIIWDNGDYEYWFNGFLHREENDEPAVHWVTGHQEWWLHGARHREGGQPAIVSNEGLEWFVHGKRHREDGPAIEYIDNDGSWYKAWYVNDLLHSETHPAVMTNSRFEWWLRGKLHKLQGPAAVWKVEDAEYQEWSINGNRHRMDGPAVIETWFKEYYINGENVTLSTLNFTRYRYMLASLVINRRVFKYVC